MPALFALALHDALQQAKQELHADDWLGAFLDDVYLVTTKERARDAFDTVASSIKEHADVDVNFGKCAAWSASGGEAPPRLEELGEKVWRCSLPAKENGLVVLGAPLGSDEFVQDFLAKRRDEEHNFLSKLLHVPDVQAAWQLLVYCAVPRANHLLRLLPPTVSEQYAKGHDEDVWSTFCSLLSQPQLTQERPQATKSKNVASLPSSAGGLSLRSAERLRDAAYWAAWADTLKVLTTKVPERAAELTATLDADAPAAARCLQEAQTAQQKLATTGFEATSWEQLASADAPSTPNDVADRPDTFSKGWQSEACRSLDQHFLRHVVTPTLNRRQRELLDSQSGPYAGKHFFAAPTEPALRVKSERFLCLLRR